ncbi:MAG: 50S ribosomal protein L24 [Patescibacteria group bacterium]|nr:50S ribosomal protein L24 [Patescibacteria group bacterium]
MQKLHVKKGDTVVILSGNEKGKTGKVLQAFPREGLVVVEGVGLHKKHQRARREGQRGQIIEKQHAIQASKVMSVEHQSKRRAKHA